jgi:nucleoside phosphorylase
MPEEIVLLAKAFGLNEKIERGRVSSVGINTNTLSFFASGIGCRGIQRTRKELAAAIKAADIVLLMGTCGALAPDYLVGHSVLCTSVQTRDGYKYDLTMPKPIKDKLPQNVLQGAILTVDSFIAHHEKKTLRNMYAGSVCIDMESYYIAKLVRDAQKEIIILKTVSDPLRAKIPDEQFVIRYFREKHPRKIMQTFLFYPIRSFFLLRFKRWFHKAIRNNTRSVKILVEELL